MPLPLHVLAIEPYFGLSHAAFLDGWRRYSRHRVEIWKLPPRDWKWRMRAAAYHFAELARTTRDDSTPDIIFASDFLNLTEWRALAPARFANLPAILYFHENQFTYPLAAAAPVDFHYGWINLSSALAADRVLFNSRYHLDSFLSATARVVDRRSDGAPLGLAEKVRSRSRVFPVGIDFAPHDAVLARGPSRAAANRPPVLLWSHRWEYDKGPDLFVEALAGLKRRGAPFRVIVCGPSGTARSPAFDEAVEELAGEIIHMGFLDGHDEYLAAVGEADFVVSTARHEFFGVSVVEAIYMGCLPVLPRALSYPELIPAHLHSRLLYEPGARLDEFLVELLRAPPLDLRVELREAAGRFDWRRLAGELDEVVAETRARGRTRG